MPPLTTELYFIMAIHVIYHTCLFFSQLFHILAKLESARSKLAIDIDSSCKCQLSSNYILLNQPYCLTAHPDWLILWGRLVGTNSSNSTDILKHLQTWGESESKVVVEGVHLTTLKFCSVSLNEGELPFCETPYVEIEGVDSSDEQEPSSSVTYIIVGIVVFMMILIFAVLVCIGTISLYRKKKVRDRQIR